MLAPLVKGALPRGLFTGVPDTYTYVVDEIQKGGCMFLDPAENLVSPTRQEADELVERIREWGDHPDTVDAFRLSSEKTLTWLKKNQVPDAWLEPDRSYSKLPDPDASGNLIRWWPSPKKFDDPAMAEARRVLLRQRAYDLGMLYFLRALASAGRIEVSRDELVDEILMPSTYFGLNQLLAFSRRRRSIQNRMRSLIPT
ncbi:MAG: hypothetical protein EOR68_22395 [Mesorhizobium sp.]|uniref:hypothetical protein n=1 Tax=Mesorhizobium sp. TaxID=1871066 RepID=UPI000FE46167|nr:hypothetical protein [Mesorhizobium sp.]RWL94322.1 MAG: hypothetical protein EOR68_22395 [Mesorhizobium sp.]TIP50173.1 MAG: hypothetical protein E5X77_07765 [Mesorhizobium sp.]TJV70247.1 MAG: hypothetical protein E5X76_21685 [Mesorhizobium sp.]